MYPFSLVQQISGQIPIWACQLVSIIKNINFEPPYINTYTSSISFIYDKLRSLIAKDILITEAIIISIKGRKQNKNIYFNKFSFIYWVVYQIRNAFENI